MEERRLAIRGAWGSQLMALVRNPRGHGGRLKKAGSPYHSRGTKRRKIGSASFRDTSFRASRQPDPRSVRRLTLRDDPDWFRKILGVVHPDSSALAAAKVRHIGASTHTPPASLESESVFAMLRASPLDDYRFIAKDSCCRSSAFLRNPFTKTRKNNALELLNGGRRVGV